MVQGYDLGQPSGGYIEIYRVPVKGLAGVIQGFCKDSVRITIQGLGFGWLGFWVEVLGKRGLVRFLVLQHQWTCRQAPI